MKRLFIPFVAVALLLSAAAPVAADPVQKQIPFTTKVPMKSGTYYLHFSLWDQAGPLPPGNMVWSEEIGPVKVKAALVGTKYYATITQLLGSVNPFDNPTNPVSPPVEFSQQLWVAVAYRTAATPTWTMAPARTRLAVVPYALWADIPPASITSTQIGIGTITDANISPAAAISDDKLATITTPGKIDSAALPGNLVTTDGDQLLSGLKTFRPSAGSVPFAVDASRNGAVANLYAARAQNADALGGKTIADLDARYALVPPSPGGRVSGYSSALIDASGATYNSVVVGADGMPVIAFDAGGTALKVAHCGTPSCSSGNSTNTTSIASSMPNAVTLKPDGLPFVASIASGNHLVAGSCLDPACTSTINTFTVDASPNAMSYPAVTAGTDGLPIISYYDATAGDLKVAHCADAFNSTPATVTPLDTTNNVGQYSSITIGADGLPIISYYDATGGDLKVYHCGNVACTAGAAATVDTGVSADVGSFSSIAVGTDGLPVVSYYDATNHAPKLLHCGNVACTAGNTTATVDAQPNVGAYGAMVIGTSGFPVIAYQDAVNNWLRVAHCGNATCTAGTTWANAGGFASTGQLWLSMATGADGLAVIVNTNAFSQLRITKEFLRARGGR